MEINNIFAKNLKKLRGRKGLSRRECAIALNIPYTTLTNWENGSKVPRIDRIPDIAKFFNVTVSELLEYPLTNEEVLHTDDCHEDPIKRLSHILYEKYKNVPDEYKPELEKEVLKYARLLKIDIDLKNNKY
ncbi:MULTISPECIES: helix-turn-helix domain-containing protein [Bacillus]|uniref:Transcriptional regulator n=2 Tax=Bacillus cereus group TaxID=86661 RepID=A0A9X6BA06_BACCE|nr:MULTISPECIES: helix-turn-helix transcriptional regulator [Bacillus cereus group]OOR74884.1 transcriptional regulator [Bacillus cereus]PFT98675.1 XRE family transcriptional regulator [Bacillus thuringiensis]